MTYGEAHEAAKRALTQEAGIRIVNRPGTVRAEYWPSEYAPAGDAYVRLTGLMREKCSFLNCTRVHNGTMTFSVSGWEAFAAAVKAGEFDHLLSGPVTVLGDDPQ